MTGDPKRVSLVEGYQELVERVFLNYQPPEESRPASPQAEEPAENKPKKAQYARSFCGTEDAVPLDGAA